jgi:hypothetical protein
MNQASKKTLTFGALLLVMGILSGCEKLSIPWPWQKKEVIQIKIDGVPSTGKEPMLMIDDQLEPLSKPTYELIKRDLYDCKGMVAPWLQNLLVAELNFLAEKSKLKLIEKPVCLLNVDKDESPKNGRFSVHFYKDTEELKACVFHQHCESARNVSLVLKNQLVFRSYFLSDFKREKFYQHCVTPEGNWIANTTCYTVEN